MQFFPILVLTIHLNNVFEGFYEVCDPLNTIQRKPDLIDVQFWRNKSGKAVKMVLFWGGAP